MGYRELRDPTGEAARSQARLLSSKGSSEQVALSGVLFRIFPKQAPEVLLLQANRRQRGGLRQIQEVKCRTGIVDGKERPDGRLLCSPAADYPP